MNYKEARRYLNELSKFGSELGLDRMRELLMRLGNPQDELKFIHIAGTNGKGSVLAYLSTILSSAGYRTGRYISPTLFAYREKIQINGKEIEKDALTKYVNMIRQAISNMQEEHVGTPTIFEVETALAFLYFKEERCEIVVLETGLGGALDATNVINTTILEVLTSISMDHMEFLGNTLEQIALQKTGIIKPRSIVVTAEQKPEVDQVIQKVCKEKECRLSHVENERITGISYGLQQQVFSYENWKNIKINLSGSYQIKNAVLALKAIEALQTMGFMIPEDRVYKGFYNTNWKGRFTQIAKEPVVIIDGAHNEEAARELKESLQLYFKGKRLFYIFGVFKDKEYQKIIDLTAPLAEHIITVETPKNSRALPAVELKEAVAKINSSVEAAESIDAAIKAVWKYVKKEDIIVIFGSLSFLGEAEKAVENEERNG